MYLSSLEINTTTLRGRNWLANPYRVHQRLCLAFANGGGGRVLFRIEADRNPPRVLVQSDEAAAWDRAFRDLPVLAGPVLHKEVRLSLQVGQRLRFLLRANPTIRRLAPRDPGQNGKRQVGPRLGLLREEDQRDWLVRKGEAGGFLPLSFDTRSQGLVSFPRESGVRGRQTHLSVEYEGHLEVTDPCLFSATYAAGVGAAKGFGFGMLSVAPG